jgi:hypothetical protein
MLETIRRHVRERLTQHRENLELWRNGTLTPTEPDPEERRVTVAQLEAAVYELERIPEVPDKRLRFAWMIQGQRPVPEPGDGPPMQMMTYFGVMPAADKAEAESGLQRIADHVLPESAGWRRPLTISLFGADRPWTADEVIAAAPPCV